ncbi:MAG: hypothetical protein F4020_03770 [Gammaproteobacteria bacterium]|nr:hypothetical protein [Gammaproteobacteria bacterium]MYK68689.1 hypothetical protein [Gammaproteobacteria bacterium]
MSTRTTHVRLTPVAAFKAELLSGDSILTLAGLGERDRSGVVELACGLLTLIAQRLVPSDVEDPRLEKTVKPEPEVMEVYARWRGAVREYENRPARLAALETALNTIHDITAQAVKNVDY